MNLLFSLLKQGPLRESIEKIEDWIAKGSEVFTLIVSAFALIASILAGLLVGGATYLLGAPGLHAVLFGLLPAIPILLMAHGFKAVDRKLVRELMKK